MRNWQNRFVVLLDENDVYLIRISLDAIGSVNRLIDNLKQRISDPDDPAINPDTPAPDTGLGHSSGTFSLKSETSASSLQETPDHGPSRPRDTQ